MTKKGTFTVKIGELFPADDTDASWLFQLAVLRDDLSFEGLGVDPAGRTQWEQHYFFRRMTVSLSEAIDLFQLHLTNAAFERVTGIAGRDSPALADLRKQIKAARIDVAELRHRIGGHLKPTNSVSRGSTPPKNVMQKYLHALDGWEGDIMLVAQGAHGVQVGDTNYRSLTAASVFFAWPEVEDEESLQKRYDGSVRRVALLAGLVTRAIDVMLQTYWKRNGLLPAGRQK